MTFPRIRTSVLPLAAGVLLLLASCGSDDDSATGTTATPAPATTASAPATTAGPAVPPPTFAPEDQAFCSAAVRIAAGDAQMQEQLAAAVTQAIQSGQIDPFAQLLASLRTSGIIDGIGEAFDDLEAAAPADQQEDVRAFGDFTTATFDDLEDLNSVEELRAWADGLSSDPDTVAVQESARSVADLVQTRCGITLTN